MRNLLICLNQVFLAAIIDIMMVIMAIPNKNTFFPLHILISWPTQIEHASTAKKFQTVKFYNVDDTIKNCLQFGYSTCTVCEQTKVVRNNVILWKQLTPCISL
jgi:hypothetical protein